MKLFVAFLAMGLASATECGQLTKCYLVNLEHNGERKVFDASGVEVSSISNTPTMYDPSESSKGWSIKCDMEETGTIDYVKYTLQDGSVQTHYSKPFFINGDNDGTWINKLDSLSTCGGAEIEVTWYTWSAGDSAPCGTKTLHLATPPPPPEFNRCHLCRRCKSVRMYTPVVFPNPFPAVAHLQVVKRGGIVTATHEFETIRYRAGKKYADSSWLEYPDFANEVEDGSVYTRSENSCGVSSWRKCSVGSPVALDLDGSGDVEHITGEFDFDLSGNGIPEELTEWFAPTEGILVDSTYPGYDSGELTGWHLYGDLAGLHEDGFEKLAMHDFNNDGVISGENELAGIAVWTDANSNAILDDGEISTLESHGVVSFELDHDENYISSATLADGSEMVTRDLWFAR